MPMILIFIILDVPEGASVALLSESAQIFCTQIGRKHGNCRDFGCKALCQGCHKSVKLEDLVNHPRFAHLIRAYPSLLGKKLRQVAGY